MKSSNGAGHGADTEGQKNASPVGTSKALSSKALVDSRGGTRTRDPGIMSAVL
jgi:hypothetical protein